MSNKTKGERIFNVSIWRYLVNLWTVIIYITILADFFTRNHFSEFIGPICTIYVALLAVYTSQKEFERWHDENVGRHPGEIYIVVWTLIVVFLFVCEIIYRTSYKLPSEIFSTYIVVMGILAITRRSKTNYCRVKEIK